MEPITGILRGYNPYELLIEVGPKQIIVFKSSIWCIEIVGHVQLWGAGAKKKL
jgi:sRNA-binding regulator protein Hfq